MKSFALLQAGALLASAAAAGPVSLRGSPVTLDLTWSDCGQDADAKVTDVTPASIQTGATSTITGTGSLDKEVTGGKFTLKTTSDIGGITILSCEGDAATTQECDLKVLGVKVGSITYTAIEFPLQPGPTTGVPSVQLELGDSLPKEALGTKTTLTATDQDGAELLCVEIETKLAPLRKPTPVLLK